MECDWYIHGVCHENRVVYHTHGLDKYNNGLELELNLSVAGEPAMSILNTIGFALAEGRVNLEDGMYEETLFSMPLHYKELLAVDSDDKVLRVILPDVNGKFPWDDNCDPQYASQLGDWEFDTIL